MYGTRLRILGRVEDALREALRQFDEYDADICGEIETLIDRVSERRAAINAAIDDMEG